MAHLFPEVGTKYRFPNSGMYMGKWWAIKKMLEWDQYRLTFDDQGYFHDFYLRQNSVKVVQDHDCILFQNCVFVPLTDFEYQESRIVNKRKNTTPCFLHFSGSSYISADGKDLMHLIHEQVPFENMIQRSKTIEGE